MRNKTIIYIIIGILILLTGIFIFTQNQNENYKSKYLKEISYTIFEDLLDKMKHLFYMLVMRIAMHVVFIFLN